MREALTVVGFILIVAFVAVFAAPLYVQLRDAQKARIEKLRRLEPLLAKC